MTEFLGVYELLDHKRLDTIFDLPEYSLSQIGCNAVSWAPSVAPGSLLEVMLPPKVVLNALSINNVFTFLFKVTSLQKHPFLLALRRWGRFAWRNICDSAAEIPY